jgi:hypothetical protein
MRPSKYQLMRRHVAHVRLNSEVIMGEDVEKVALPFDEVTSGEAAIVPVTDGSLALSAAPGVTVDAAARCHQRGGVGPHHPIRLHARQQRTGRVLA